MYSPKSAIVKSTPRLQYLLQRWAATNAAPELPPCDFKPEPYTGQSYDEILRIKSTHVNPAMRTNYKRPLLLHQGHMQWLYDQDNRRYLDMFAGIVTVSCGHSHPKVVEAAQKQAGRLTHTSATFLNPPYNEAAEKLASKMPGDLKVVFFGNSGTDANDVALLMAKLHTGTDNVITLRGSYHGANLGLQGITAISSWRYNVVGASGMVQTMNPDPYRGVWGGSQCRDSVAQPARSCDCAPGQCKAGDMYLQQLDDVLNSSVPKGKVAAFIAESIQGVGGGIQFPKNFLKGAYERIREKGGLCIADEVQTGFGRTGTHMWGFEGHEVQPDIVTMAKGIANGFPLSAAVTTPKIAERLADALFINTFGGNPVSTAAASAVLDVIDEEGLQQNAHEVGTYFLNEALKLRDEYDIVGDVRGKGLMTAIELVSNKETRQPIDQERINLILETTKDLGVIIGVGGVSRSVLRIKPPLCITKTDVDFTISCLRFAFDKTIQQS